MAGLGSRSLRAGELIFAEGEPADCAYIIEAGEVEILAGEGDALRCVAVLSAGSLLGEMGILDDEPRSATARARSEVLLTVIERSQLQSRLQQSDSIIRMLMSVFLNRLREKLGKGERMQLNFPATERQAAIERIKLENELKAGIEAGEMQLFLQPIVDFATRKVQGFESLVRWARPQRGMVRPDHFIPLAEQTGLIIPMGRWILRTACEYALRFEREHSALGLQGQGSFMSVNVSTRQFQDPRFLPQLQQILDETGLAPQRLKLEITESALTDAAAAKQWIADVKNMGVRIALDDFGTGYSSLSYLHEFAIDVLKIDQSFVRRMLEDHRCERIVAAIITIAQALDLDIIAEGVETEAHYARLHELGCQYCQGYLIARPQPISQYF